MKYILLMKYTVLQVLFRVWINATTLPDQLFLREWAHDSIGYYNTLRMRATVRNDNSRSRDYVIGEYYEIILISFIIIVIIFTTIFYKAHLHCQKTKNYLFKIYVL